MLGFETYKAARFALCCALGKGLLGSGLEEQAVQAQGAGELGFF